MKTIKFIGSWFIMTFLLLFSVVITDLVNSLFISRDLAAQAVGDFYPVKDMLFGFLSEALRALLLCYLFPQQRTAGRSYSEAIKFGLVISALIGTMWLVVGYGSFVLKDPGALVVYDGIILVLQGILSGVGLQWLYSRRFIGPLPPANS